VLTVQDSSQAVLCQEADVYSAGLLHKPLPFRTLWDLLHGTEEDPKRFSTLCKLLYHRLSGSHRSTVELFVTDSSLQNVTPFAEMTDELLQYVKIFGKSNHVLPEELRKARTNAGAILSAKNLLLQANQEVIADTYSVIRTAVPDSTTIAVSGYTFHEEPVSQVAIDSLSSLKPAALPCLTRHARHGYIYCVEGVVIGVDEESACCWLVCGTCENADITIKQKASPQFFCSSCDVAVNSPKTKTHLAVFVKVKSFPEAHVRVALQQSSIDKLLPVRYQDNDQGYDIEDVLDKQLGPMSCYVTEQQDRSSFCLEEIPIE